jgi:predicted O-linked N-acetylglucosamine transferase (SPINDLY family)
MKMKMKTRHQQQKMKFGILWLLLVAAAAVDDAFFRVPELHSMEDIRARNESHWTRVYPALTPEHERMLQSMAHPPPKPQRPPPSPRPSTTTTSSSSSPVRLAAPQVSAAELLNAIPKRKHAHSSSLRRPQCPFVCPVDAATRVPAAVLIFESNALAQQNDLGGAAACMDRALDVDATAVYVWMQLILLYERGGHASLAADTAAAALVALPQAPELYSKFVELRGDERDWADLVRHDPTSYYAWGRLGQVFEKRGETERAMLFYEHALSVVELPAVVPPDVEVVLVAYFNNLLQTYLKAPHRYVAQAIPLCERAIQLFTVYRSHFVTVLVQLYSMPGPHQNRARVAELQRAELPATAAAAAADSATAGDAGNDGELVRLFELGKQFLQSGELERALEAFEMASVRAPHVAAAHYAVAVVLKSLHVADQQATERLKRAFELEPHNQEYSNTYVHSLKAVADWDSLAPLLPAWRAEIEAGTRALHPFSCLMFGLSPEVLLRESVRFGEQHAAMAAHLQKSGAAPVFDAAARRGARLRAQCDDDGSCDAIATPKLRIGYLSSNFINHAQGAQLSSFFSHNDNSVASVHLYSMRMAKTGEALEAQALIDRAAAAAGGELLDVTQMSDAQVAQRIFDDKIDVLVDLCGLADEARPTVLALRPAPVVVSYLGYPATTGGAFVDYYVGDRQVTPPEQFVEQVAFMPHSYQLTEHYRRYPPSEAVVLAPSMLGTAASRFASGDERVVFCNFNQAIKIDPEVFDVWMRIMKRVEGSDLWLLELPKAAQPHLTRAAKARGVAASRLHFMPSINKLYHMRRLSRCDLLLDTTSYTAHTSCGDALWAGTPVLTIPGATMAARVAAGMLHAANLSDAGLVVSNLAEYEERAVALGNDRSALTQLKARVAKVRDAEPPVPLFDISKYYRHWSALLRHVWRRAVLEQAPPKQFDVSDLAEANDETWADFSFRGTTAAAATDEQQQ